MAHTVSVRNRPALKTTLLFIGGILLDNHLNLPLVPVLCFSSLLLIGSIYLFIRRKRFVSLILSLGLLSSGALYYQVRFNALPGNHISNFLRIEEPLVVEGVVVKAPEAHGDKRSLILETKQVKGAFGSSDTRGKVLVNIHHCGKRFEYGDRILIQGRLRTPRDERNPGEFNYRSYLRRRGIFGIISVYGGEEIKVLNRGEGGEFFSRVIYPVRHYVSDLVDKTIGDSEGALLKGLLIGERAEIPQEIKESFARTGVIHVLAISGLHVGFILAIFITLFSLFRLPYKVRMILTMGALAFYVLITDMRPSVIRASIMAGTVLLGNLLGRRIDIYNILALAALIILLINPSDLFEIGFQLSFVAVLSILYFYERLKSLFSGLKLPGYLLTVFLISLAAQLGTLPLTAYYFGRVPLISLLSNLIVVPAVGLIVALGFTSIIMGVFCWRLAETYAGANWLILTGLIKLVRWTEGLPFAYLEHFSLNWFHLIGYYVGIVLLVNVRERVWRKRALIFTLIFLNLLLWMRILSGKDESLRVIFFDVGKGRAALLRFPDGNNILIDGGKKSRGFDPGRKVIYPYLRRQGIRKLDLVISTSPNWGGLSYIFKNMKVTRVMRAGEDEQKIGLKRQTFRDGDTIVGIDNCKILVFLPPIGSVVLKVVYGGVSFLFVGEIEERGLEEFLLHQGDALKSHLLVVDNLNTSLIEKVDPAFIITSSKHFINHRLPLKSQVIRPNRTGAAIFETDGNWLRRIR